jgi:hypothetical protein
MSKQLLALFCVVSVAFSFTLNASAGHDRKKSLNQRQTERDKKYQSRIPRELRSPRFAVEADEEEAWISDSWDRKMQGHLPEEDSYEDDSQDHYSTHTESGNESDEQEEEPGSRVSSASQSDDASNSEMEQRSRDESSDEASPRGNWVPQACAEVALRESARPNQGLIRTPAQLPAHPKIILYPLTQYRAALVELSTQRKATEESIEDVHAYRNEVKWNGKNTAPSDGAENVLKSMAQIRSFDQKFKDLAKLYQELQETFRFFETGTYCIEGLDSLEKLNRKDYLTFGQVEKTRQSGLRLMNFIQRYQPLLERLRVQQYLERIRENPTQVFTKRQIRQFNGQDSSSDE